ncbi:MarR family winged helix-turn-helix transcriptional regulator [Caballeronia novacaledonica]|uniref:Winged helix-turn-helix transcriptional regulator n=1 Tax=Caballeronia novacaledonica TaxID=1544861 RepID=A0AA37IIN3_9BURK|nr:MarR family winged helix-turn-helix transcriptional regulator [Caballeronia novacaledonica]GJH29962.1 winged helix-turn-helix transcriptional regulator [Caballeronia novacaledonica]
MSKHTVSEYGPCSCTALRKANRRISQIYDAVLAPTGLKITQRAILAQVGRSGPIGVGALAEALVMDAGALAHTLKPLQRDGLVSIDPDPDDRRHRIVSLTPSGRAKLAESDALWIQAQTAFESAVGKVEARALHKALARLSDENFLAAFEAGFATRAGK